MNQTRFLVEFACFVADDVELSEEGVSNRRSRDGRKLTLPGGSQGRLVAGRLVEEREQGKIQI